MNSKFPVQRISICSRMSIGFLLGYVTIAAISQSGALGQESGVKIALTLTPSKPEEPKKPADVTPAGDRKKSTKEAAGEKKEPEKSPSEIPESTSTAKQNPFVLSAFELPVAADDKSKEKSTDLQSKTKTETAPSFPSLDLKLPSSEAASPKTDKALTPDGTQTKPKPIKPLRIDVPKLDGQKRSDPSDNEDANGTSECPGGADGAKPLPTLPDDIPLDQEDHPYDAPAAESTSVKTDRPARVPQQLSTDQLRLRSEINQCLRYFMQNPETIARRSPWAVMHAILPFGVEAELSAGNRRVSAIGWMSYNGLCKTQRIFQSTKTGFRTNLGPGVQGHEGQFLAILAQSKVSPTYPIKVGTRNYTVNDLVKYEMATCRENSELTFKLLGLSYYLDQNQRWRDNQGGQWSLEKLVAEELEQPVVGAACGGTHRLMGLTFSLLQRKQAGLPINGHWDRAEQFLDEFVQYAFTLQNPDGSFSTEWFETRANDPNVERKVQTTGHILEWLVYTLPDEQLQSPPIQKALHFILSTIGAEPNRDWPIGPRGHSLRALALYNQRVFGAQPGKLKQYLANLNTESKQR